MSTAASIGRASSPIHNKLALWTRRLGTTVVGPSAKPLRRMKRALPTRLDSNKSARVLQRNIMAAVPQLANKCQSMTAKGQHVNIMAQLTNQRISLNFSYISMHLQQFQLFVHCTEFLFVQCTRSCQQDLLLDTTSA